MGLFSELLVHKKGDSNIQQTHIWKHVSLTSHKNANWKHIEIISYPSQNGIYKKTIWNAYVTVDKRK